jgi:uncharacterized protein YndB with AHSA1/START domain
MSQPLYIKNEITIDASAETVWDALVNPAKTKQYMFGCETVSDWQPGSSLEWVGEHEGKPIVYVKGSIVEIDPGRFLSYTTIDPHSNIDDTSENYLTVTYTLESQNGQTHFTVTQGDYAKVAEGERRYNDSWNNGVGWQPILDQVKQLVENK